MRSCCTHDLARDILFWRGRASSFDCSFSTFTYARFFIRLTWVLPNRENLVRLASVKTEFFCTSQKNRNFGLFGFGIGSVFSSSVFMPTPTPDAHAHSNNQHKTTRHPKPRRRGERDTHTSYSSGRHPEHPGNASK